MYWFGLWLCKTRILDPISAAPVNFVLFDAIPEQKTVTQVTILTVMSGNESEDVDWADTSAFDKFLGIDPVSEEDEAGMFT